MPDTYDDPDYGTYQEPPAPAAPPPQPPPPSAPEGENIFAQFHKNEPAPKEENIFAQFHKDEAPPKDENIFAQFHKPPEPKAPEPKAEEQEGPVKTFLRHAAHAVLPTAGAVAGAEAGATVGGGIGAAVTAPLGGWGALPGAIIGGLVGGVGGYLGTSMVQEAGLKELGHDDSVAMALGAKLNPKSALGGDVAGSLPFFGVGAATALTRGVGGVAGSGLEAGSQYLSGEEPDYSRIAGAGAAGMLLTKPTGATEKISGAVSSLLGRASPYIRNTAVEAGRAAKPEPPVAPVQGEPPRTEAGAQPARPSTDPAVVDTATNNTGFKPETSASTAEQHVEPPSDATADRKGPEDWGKKPEPTAAQEDTQPPIYSTAEMDLAVREALSRPKNAAASVGRDAGAQNVPGITANLQAGPEATPEIPRAPVTAREPARPPARPEEPVTRAPEQPALEQPAPVDNRIPPVEEPTETGPKLDREFPKVEPQPAAPVEDDGGIPPFLRRTREAAVQRPDEMVRGAALQRQPVLEQPKFSRQERSELTRYVDDQSGDPATIASMVARSSLGKDTVVYRGHSADDPMRGYQEGFVSASRDRDVAAMDNPKVSKIIVDKNAPALNTEQHTLNDLHHEESEVLLGKGKLVPTGEPNTYRFTADPSADAIQRKIVGRGRSGRPIETEPLPIGSEDRILQAGYERATGPKGEPQQPDMQAMARQPRPMGQQQAQQQQPVTPTPQPSNLSRLTRAIQGIVAPQTRGPEGIAARDLIRGSTGEANRLADQTSAMLDTHRDTARLMDEPTSRAVNNLIEGGKAFPNYKPTPEQQKLISEYKPIMDIWKRRLQGLGRTATMDFYDNYLAHNMYENPAKAQEFFQGFSKRGSAGSTRERTFPTLEDAYAAGIKPISNNPVEMGQRYINSIKSFVAANDVIERGLATGHVQYFGQGKMIGASGAAQPFQRGGPPPGWVKLDGAPQKLGQDAYAPEDFARVYNNFYDQGMMKNNRDLVKGAMKASNAWTALELGLNTYHLFTMANEAIIVDVKRGLNQMFSGQFGKGLKTAAGAPFAPVTRGIEGRKFQREWLDPTSTDPMAGSIGRANARPIGRGHASDYTYAERGSFIRDFRNGIGPELANAMSEIKSDWKGADSLGKQAMFPIKQAARVLQTVAAPLFDHYIPMLKAGAIHAQMKDWVEAQPNFDIKNLTPAQQLAMDHAAIRITDSVDNSFGEMVHENLFMNQTLKQSAQVAMRSFSWNIGTMKEIGGGLYAGGKALGALAKGENRFSMANPEFDPRIAYSIAMPFVVATTSAIYQYLRTGETPQDWRDLYAPRTGGKVPGGKEHVLMPGYQKDVLGWIMHPLREAYGKLGGLPTTIIEQVANRDWKDQPISKSGAPIMDQLQQRAEHIYSKMGPISVKNMIKGQKEGSKITPVETALGFHTVSAEIQAPQRYANFQRQKAQREWQAKQVFDRKQKLLYNRPSATP